MLSRGLALPWRPPPPIVTNSVSIVTKSSKPQLSWLDEVLRSRVLIWVLCRISPQTLFSPPKSVTQYIQSRNCLNVNEAYLLQTDVLLGAGDFNVHFSFPFLYFNLLTLTSNPLVVNNLSHNSLFLIQSEHKCPNPLMGINCMFRCLSLILSQSPLGRVSSWRMCLLFKTQSER